MRPRISAAALLVKVTASSACGLDALNINQPCRAMHEHPCFAATGTRDHQGRRGRGSHCLALRVIQ